ncbi:MAG: radical SAM family heme chaperone HemW [candidate division KSB1 bacterium]|nr:radical SAM family heme chaperone HemW [candidate division KSB1 bacterium]
MKAALYIHIPFCRKKCPYCDFYSVVDCDRMTAFIRALETEIQYYAGTIWSEYEYVSIYFGGGTPSLLAPGQVHSIINMINKHFRIVFDAEITLEANPGAVFSKHLKQYNAAGVNRISLGVQSLADPELLKLGRIHDAGQAEKTLDLAKQVFDQVSVDLIFGIPGQTIKSWQKSLDKVLDYEPEHLSVYGLTFEPGTRFEIDLASGRLKPVHEELERSLYLTAHSVLTRSGYQHYELSNYAGPGCESRHNQMYWTGDAYLGLGPDAHSYSPPDKRMGSAKDLALYLAELGQNGQPPVDLEVLSFEQRLVEFVMLHLRRRPGIPLQGWTHLTGTDFLQAFESVISALGTEEQTEPFEISPSGSYLVIHPGHLSLSAQGVLLYNTIVQRFIEKL